MVIDQQTIQIIVSVLTVLVSVAHMRGNNMPLVSAILDFLTKFRNTPPAPPPANPSANSRP